MLQNLDFDFSLFEDVPSPKSHNTVCRLTLAAEDRLSQNEAFHRALQGTTAFRLQVSSDGRFLRLDPNGPCNLTFTNAGVRTHHPFGDLLRQKGLEPPLSYSHVLAGGPGLLGGAVRRTDRSYACSQAQGPQAAEAGV